MQQQQQQYTVQEREAHLLQPLSVIVDQKVPDFYQKSYETDNNTNRVLSKLFINENEFNFYELNQYDSAIAGCGGISTVITKEITSSTLQTAAPPIVQTTKCTAQKRANSCETPTTATSSVSTVTATKSTHHAMKRVLCDDDLATSNRLFKKSRSLVTLREMKEFNSLLENDTIKKFLDYDKCYLVTDKYTLSMVFIYFKRARYELSEYTKLNFFLALYLANDIEEDIDEYKYEILPWALGSNKWRNKFLKFLKKRDSLLKLIDYRAFVSRKCCEEVMLMMPDHPAWKRTRSADHGGATRSYLIRKADIENGCDGFLENELLLPRGPDYSPRKCPLCTINSKKQICKPDKFDECSAYSSEED